MRKATMAMCVLVLLSAVAFAGFVVNPPQDTFDMVQNTSVVRTYLVQSNDTSGVIDLSTSVAWAYDTTDFLNVTPGKTYNAKVTFSPEMIAPGDYTVLVSFKSKGDSRSVKTQVKVVKAYWVYGYLIPGESYSDITWANMSVAGNAYSLVIIKGTDAFLLKNNKEIVKDSNEIRQFYEAYYGANLYPKDSEIAQLKALLENFNNSRNIRTQFGPAEHTCKQYTGMNDNPCYDRRSCELACNTLVELCGPALGALGGPFADSLVEFGTETSSMDKHYMSILGNLSSLDFSSVTYNLEKAKADISSIKSSALIINGSKLRYDMKCRDCYGICPSMPYNVTALDAALSLISTLQTRATPIKDVVAKANDLASKTNQRISQVIGKEHKEGYMKRYDVIKPLADEISKNVATATSNVNNPGLQQKFSELKNATASLEWAIDNGDYSNVTKLDAFFDSNIDKFYSAKSEVEALLSETTGLYEKVDAARQNASGYIVRAGMNVQPGDQAELELNILRARMANTEANFTTPLSAELAGPLMESYSAIALDGKRIAETKPSTSILGRMVSKIVRTEKWIALSLIGLFKPLTLQEKTLISEYVAPATAGLLAMCLAGMLLLFLVIYALRNRKRLDKVRHQIMLYSFFSAMTMMVALVCLVLFYSLTQIYSGEATLNLFRFELTKAGGVAVFVDESTAYSSQDPVQTKALMSECGERIASSLSHFKPKVYYIDKEVCRVGGNQYNYTDCDKEFSALPVIYVRSGPNHVSFRTLYAVNATFEGGNDWLLACHLAGALRD